MAVDGADANPGASGDVLHLTVEAALGEAGTRRLLDRLAIAPGVGPQCGNRLRLCLGSGHWIEPSCATRRNPTCVTTRTQTESEFRIVLNETGTQVPNEA